MGGAHQRMAQIQEKMIPAVAHFPSNRTFPKGLHTTTHLSQEITVRDHRPAIPVQADWSLVMFSIDLSYNTELHEINH